MISSMTMATMIAYLMPPLSAERLSFGATLQCRWTGLLV
jgi:hypothetical protein